MCVKVSWLTLGVYICGNKHPLKLQSNRLNLKHVLSVFLNNVFGGIEFLFCCCNITDIMKCKSVLMAVNEY